MSYLLLDNLSNQDFYGLLARRHLRNARLFIGLLLAVLVGYLIFGPKPWDEGLTAAVDKVIAQTPAGELPQLKLQHFVIPWAYAIACVNTVICAFLLVTVGKWAKPAQDISLEGGTGLIVEARAWWDSAWWFWGILLIVFGIGLGLRVSTVGQSLWWDEAWTVKRVIVGYQEPKLENPTELEFKDVSWLKTFFYYEKPTNHVGYSVLARLCNDAWRSMSGAEPAAFSEVALRLPALLAGVLCLVLVGMILKDMGHPWLGLIAALLLALHPWHIRYSVDARAFTFCAFFSLLAVWALGRGLKHGSWRYWILLALSQFMMLWAFPYTLFYAALLGIAAVLGILVAYGSIGGSYLQRYLVCATVAGMLFLQLATPWWPQIQRWSGTMVEDGVEPVNGALVREFWVQSTAGTPWLVGTNEMAGGLPCLSTVIGDLPWPLSWLGYGLIFGFFPFLLLVGAGRLLISRSPSSVVILVPALAVPVTLLIAMFRSDWFYERYLFFGMPFVIILMLIGAFHLAAGTEGNFRLGGFISVGVYGLFFIILCSSQLYSVLARPVEPMREIARFFEQRRGDNPTLPIRAGYQHGGSMPALYDPWIRQALTAADLKSMAAEAKARKATFYVFYGHEGFNRGMFPDGFLYLDKPLLFKERARFLGQEPDYNYRVLEYTGIPWPEPETTSDGKPTLEPETRTGEVELRQEPAAPATPPVLVPGTGSILFEGSAPSIAPEDAETVPMGLELNPAGPPSNSLPEVDLPPVPPAEVQPRRLPPPASPR